MHCCYSFFHLMAVFDTSHTALKKPLAQVISTIVSSMYLNNYFYCLDKEESSSHNPLQSSARFSRCQVVVLFICFHVCFAMPAWVRWTWYLLSYIYLTAPTQIIGQIFKSVASTDPPQFKITALVFALVVLTTTYNCC